MPPWERYQQASPTADPVIARDPYKISAEQRAQEDQERQREQFNRTETRQGVRDAQDQSNTTFNQYSKLRDDFNALPDVKDYRAAIKSYSTALKSGEDPAGDLNLIYAFAKIMDPGSVVREGEAAAISSGDTLAGQWVARLQKELTGDGTFRPEYRNQLRQELQTRIAEMNRGYNTQRDQFRQYASAAGLDPEQVVGVHDGRAFYDDVKKYWEERGGKVIEDGKDAQGNPLPAGARVDPSLTAPSGGGDDGFFRMPTSWEQFGRGLAQGTGDIVEAVGDFAGIVGNPLNATINAVTGSKLSTDLGTTLREGIGLPDNPNRVASAINKGGVSALTGSLGARGLASVVTPGTTRGALSTFGRTPGRDMLAGAGAGFGGEVGGAIGGLPGRIIGTVAGGGAGYASGGALAKVATPRQPNALMQSADELGVTMLPADVGGTGTRMATGAVGRTLGGIPIAEGAQQAVSSAGAARSRIASEIGDVADNVGAGQAAKRGFDAFEKSSARRAEQLYERVSVPAKSAVQLGNTRGALEEVTRGMQSNPELSRLWANHPRLRATLEALTPKDVAGEGRQAFMEASDRLTALQDQFEQARNAVTDPKQLDDLRSQIAQARQDLTNAKGAVDTPPEGGNLSWEDMKRFRSIVGEVIGQPGIARDGSDIAALRKLYGAITTDMEVSAAQAGSKALQEFRRASQYWRGRESRIEDVFTALLGKGGTRSDEAVFKQINNWAKTEGGDFSRIARTIRSMPADEANTIRATIVNRMGMARPAGQDATGEVFSPAEFATQWRGMSPRAKNVLFPNKQHRQDLEKFAGLMDGMKRASEFQNYSNTALGANLTMTGLTGMTGIPGVIAAGAYSGGTFALGKLLASPRFARAMASTSKMPPETAQRKLSEQLKVLAAQEPVLAADAKALQAYLAEQIAKSPGRAAAEDTSDSRRVPPEQ